jgi:hypothetical protein
MVLRSASRRVFQAAQKTQQRSVTDITKIKEKRAKFYKDSNYGQFRICFATLDAELFLMAVL